MDEQENTTETKVNSNFVNPFTPGVNYADFLEAVGKKTVEDYCKGKLEPGQLEWLIEDLTHYKTK